MKNGQLWSSDAFFDAYPHALRWNKYDIIQFALAVHFARGNSLFATDITYALRSANRIHLNCALNIS